MSLPGNIRLWMAYNLHLGFHPQPKRVLFSWLEKQSKMCVAQGPFRGMKLVPASFGSSLMPKMVGTYELEIQTDLEELLAREYRYFFDIGAAEGYYAVGVAMRLKNSGTQTFAYDIAPDSARAVQQASEMNGVNGKLHMRQLCRHGDFELARSGKTLLICDIEGAEAELLDPVAAPSLRHCDIIVEVHDGPERHDIRSLLEMRFQSSHELVLRKERPRARKDLGRLRWMLPRDLGRDVMCEGRALGIEWLVLKSKERASGES